MCECICLVLLLTICLGSIFGAGIIIRLFTDYDYGITYLLTIFKNYSIWSLSFCITFYGVAILLKMQLDFAIKIVDIKKNKSIKDINIINQNIRKIISIIIINFLIIGVLYFFLDYLNSLYFKTIICFFL